MLREINKACIGFKDTDHFRDIATGNWGCGAFNGNVQLKFVLQWIAAGLTGRSIRYYPFGSKELAKVPSFIENTGHLSVSQLFEATINAASIVETSKSIQLGGSRESEAVDLFDLIESCCHKLSPFHIK